MRRKWLSGILITCLLGSLLAACSDKEENKADPTAAPTAAATAAAPTKEEPKVDPFGKYPQTVSFTTVKSTSSDPKFPSGESYEKNKYNDFMIEKLNVKPQILWAVPSDGEAYKQKLELSIAANDIPDIMVINGDPSYLKKTLKRIVEAGMVEDLTHVIKNYASPKIKEAYEQNNNRTLDFFAIDGKSYAIPEQKPMADFSLVWVRDDWRKQLNLQEPKTMEDLIAIAKAFKEKDPAGGGKTVPIVVQMQNDPVGMFGGGAFFDYFSSFPRSFYKGAGDKVVYGGIEPQTKDALAMMAQMYKDGLFEKDFALKDSGKAMELLANGSAGMVSHMWWGVWYPLNQTLQNNPKADWKPYAVTGKNGKFTVSAGIPASSLIVVKKGFKYPELPMKWMNIWKENDQTQWTIDLYNGLYKDAVEKTPILFNTMVNPTNKDFKKAGRLVEALDGKLTKDQLATFDEKDAYDQISKFKAGMNEPDNNTKNMPGWQNYKGWIEAMNSLNKANPTITFKAFEGRTPTMEKKMTALENLQMNVYLKIIMGKEPVEAFDTFVKDWKAQGGDDILAEVQKEVGK